jgi:hypothetical protein
VINSNCKFIIHFFSIQEKRSDQMMTGAKIVIRGGGIIPKFVSKRGIELYLCAREHKMAGWADSNKWSAFEGGIKHGETVEQTVAREFHEESLGLGTADASDPRAMRAMLENGEYAFRHIVVTRHTSNSTDDSTNAWRKECLTEKPANWISFRRRSATQSGDEYKTTNVYSNRGGVKETVDEYIDEHFSREEHTTRLFVRVIYVIEYPETFYRGIQEKFKVLSKVTLDIKAKAGDCDAFANNLVHPEGYLHRASLETLFREITRCIRMLSIKGGVATTLHNDSFSTIEVASKAGIAQTFDVRGLKRTLVRDTDEHTTRDILDHAMHQLNGYGKAFRQLTMATAQKDLPKGFISTDETNVYIDLSFIEKSEVRWFTVNEIEDLVDNPHKFTDKLRSNFIDMVSAVICKPPSTSTG